MHSCLLSHDQTMIHGVSHPLTQTENGQNLLPLHCKQMGPTAVIAKRDNDNAFNYRTKKLRGSNNNARLSDVYQQFLSLQPRHNNKQLINTVLAEHYWTACKLKSQITQPLEEWMKLLLCVNSKSDLTQNTTRNNKQEQYDTKHYALKIYLTGNNIFRILFLQPTITDIWLRIVINSQFLKNYWPNLLGLCHFPQNN